MRLARYFLLPLALVCQFLAALPPAQAERRVGLVIGIDRYPGLPQTAQLTKAVADARAVRELLTRTLGFQRVVYGENATLAQARELLLDFSRSIAAGDLAFVYFAGHGMNVRLANYLLPADLPPPRDVTSQAQVRLEEESMVERSISEERVRDLIAQAGARAAIVVLDACRNNIFREALAAYGPRTRTLSAGTEVQGPRPIERRRGSGRTQFLSLYSASPGQKALDSLGPSDTHPNSPFTRVLVARLASPGQRIHEAMRALRTDVVRLAEQAGHEQVPAISDEALDDIVLSGTAAPQAPAGAAPVAQVSGPVASAAPVAPPVVVTRQPPASPPLAPVPAPAAGANGWTGWRLMPRSGTGIGVVALAVSPDGATVAASYRDKSVRLWSLVSGQQMAVLKTLAAPASELAFDQAGGRLAAVADLRLEVWSLPGLQKVTEVPVGRERISEIAFTAEGGGIVARPIRGAIRAFDLATRQERVATPEDAQLVGTSRQRPARGAGPAASLAGNAVRVQRGRRGGDSMMLIALAGGGWIAIGEDGLSFTGPAASLASFELAKGRDRLAVSEEFVRAFERRGGLARN